MSLLFIMLSRLVITFLPKIKRLLISWLQSPSAVILEPRNTKSATVSSVSPSICHEVMGPDAMIFVSWMLSFKPTYYNFLNFSCLKTNPRSLRRVGERWPGHQAQNPLSSCRSDYSQPDRFHFTVQHEIAVWAAPQRFRLRTLCPLVSFSRLQPSWGLWTCWPWCSVGCSQGWSHPCERCPFAHGHGSRLSCSGSSHAASRRPGPLLVPGPHLSTKLQSCSGNS